MLGESERDTGRGGNKDILFLIGERKHSFLLGAYALERA